VRYCADGASNRLYECTVGHSRVEAESATSEHGTLAAPHDPPCSYVPDVIRGDLDSIHPHVRTYYE
jgi:thiamine pyrophosphokinase